MSEAPDATAGLTPLSAADFEMLLEASRALGSELRLSELLSKVMVLAARVVRAEAGSILLLDEGTGTLSFDATVGTAGERLKGARLKVGEGIAGWVAANKKPLIVNDVHADSRWSSRADKDSAFVTRQVLAVPLMHQGRCVGVVEGINKQEGVFSSADRRAMEIFGAQVAVAVENARLFEGLREEKATLAALFGEMSDGALLLGDADRTLMMNESAARLLGLGDEAIGRTLWEVTKGFDVKPGWEQGAADGVVQLTRKEGKSLILSGTLQRLKSGHGRLLIFRDVTDLRKEEWMKRRFLSLVSHKLKTPLSVINGYTPLLLKDKGLTEIQRRGLEAVEAQGKRLAALVDKLLGFTATEGEGFELARQSLVPRLEIDSVIKDLAGLVEHRQAKVILDPSLDNLPAVLADAGRFRDVFRNLVENAVKFNESAEKKVILRGESVGGMVRVVVEDNGPGIPPEEIPKLFDAFHQIEENFTGQIEGAGLGLALCKRLVEAHGGRLLVESAPGSGAVFETRWPKAT